MYACIYLKYGYHYYVISSLEVFRPLHFLSLQCMLILEIHLSLLNLGICIK